MSIAIFPASGSLGKATNSHLLKLVDPKDVILVARTPEKLAEEKKAGAIIRQADYDDPKTLKDVFEGAKVLNLIAYPSIHHEHRSEVSCNTVPCRLCGGLPPHCFHRGANRFSVPCIFTPPYRPKHLIFLSYLFRFPFYQSWSHSIGRQGRYRFCASFRGPTYILLLPRLRWP